MSAALQPAVASTSRTPHFAGSTLHTEASAPIQDAAAAAAGRHEPALCGTALLRKARVQREESHRQALQSVAAQCAASLAELSDDDHSDASFGTALEARLSSTEDDGL